MGRGGARRRAGPAGCVAGPGYTAFPSVDALHGELTELASAHPDLMRHHHIGASRLVFYLNRDDPTLAKRLATLPGLLGIPSTTASRSYPARQRSAPVPTWADARIGDQSPSGHTHGQILAGQARREVVDTMAASMQAVAGDLSVHSPFRRSTENTLAIFRTLAELTAQPRSPRRSAAVSCCT